MASQFVGNLVRGVYKHEPLSMEPSNMGWPAEPFPPPPPLATHQAIRRETMPWPWGFGQWVPKGSHCGLQKLRASGRQADSDASWSVFSELDGENAWKWVCFKTGKLCTFPNQIAICVYLILDTPRHMWKTPVFMAEICWGSTCHLCLMPLLACRPRVMWEIRRHRRCRGVFVCTHWPEAIAIAMKL